MNRQAWKQRPDPCAILLAAFFIATTPISVLAESEKLVSIQRWIEQTYPAVDHLPSNEFLNQYAGDRELVVFDVREPEEFAVSHLDGAIQIDPEIARDRFISAHGGQLRGKTVVFYCSVGRRSSLLADLVADDLIEAGAADVFNLQYGIFGWHNERKPLTRNSAPTDEVHPFSWRWKRYLERKELARYKVD